MYILKVRYMVSYTKAAHTKEHSCVKDLELLLKDLKSHSQSEANASVLPPRQWDQHCGWSYPHGPFLSQRQDHHTCPHLSQGLGPLAYPGLEMR